MPEERQIRAALSNPAEFLEHIPNLETFLEAVRFAGGAYRDALYQILLARENLLLAVVKSTQDLEKLAQECLPRSEACYQAVILYPTLFRQVVNVRGDLFFLKHDFSMLHSSPNAVKKFAEQLITTLTAIPDLFIRLHHSPHPHKETIWRYEDQVLVNTMNDFPEQEALLWLAEIRDVIPLIYRELLDSKDNRYFEILDRTIEDIISAHLFTFEVAQHIQNLVQQCLDVAEGELQVKLSQHLSFLKTNTPISLATNLTQTRQRSGIHAEPLQDIASQPPYTLAAITVKGT